MSEFVTVDISQGTLRGKRVSSNDNKITYCSFQGIPYAKPPVGTLRFQPPEEPDPWTGTLDATKEGAIAPQIDVFSNKFAGEEDCLFLNVYTPQCPATTPKAVMVWIHGGAFMLGSGNSDIYGPDYLVAQDVVLVTINYRVGALGFLYLDGADVTGNNGLRDQVMALKWVKKNIAHFGGDPNNVTIFGESAGGCSVHYLLLSPLAKGLFHRAIAQSGTALLSGCHTPHEVSSRRAILLAKMLGCKSENPQEVADFLRTVTPESFVTTQSEAAAEDEKHRLLMIPFVPCEEVGPDAFLPASPRNILREGNFTKVPAMMGVTSAEGKLIMHGLFAKMKLAELDQKFENVLPQDLAPNIGSARSKEIATMVKNFYFGKNRLDDDTIIQYIDMMSDLLFVHPLYETVQSQVRWSPHPTYVYLFDHMDESRINLLTNTVDELPGAPHAAELMYLFQSSVLPRSYSPDSPDGQVHTVLVQLWANFAKTGNPSNGETKVIWNPVGKEKQEFLKINGGFNMESDMFMARMKFVREIYEKYSAQKTRNDSADLQ